MTDIDATAPVFVVGAAGAHTELVVRALGRHSATRAVAAAAALGSVDAIAGGEELRRHLEALPVDRAPDSGARSVIDAGERIDLIPALGDLYPGAQFVHVTRDPRELAVAELEASKGADLAVVGKAWLDELSTPLAFAAEHPDRVVRAPLEQLIGAASSELSRLCVALGLPDEGAAIARLTAAELDPRTLGTRWPDVLEIEQLEVIEQAVQPTLTLLGYMPATEARSFTALKRKAELYDALLEEHEGLRQRLRELESGSDPSLSAGAEDLEAHSERVAELEAEARTLRFKAGQYDSFLEEDQDLRFKAGEYDSLAPELQRLRFRAANYEKLAEEVRSLRYKAGRYDEVSAENVSLRFKARRYDKIRRALAPVRPLVRLALRVRRVFIRQPRH